MKGNGSQSVHMHIISAAKLVLVKFNCSPSCGFQFIFNLHQADVSENLCCVTTGKFILDPYEVAGTNRRQF